MFKSMTKRGNLLMYILYIITFFLIFVSLLNACQRNIIQGEKVDKIKTEQNRNKIKIYKFEIVNDKDFKETLIDSNRVIVYYAYDYNEIFINDKRYYSFTDINGKNIVLRYNKTDVYKITTLAKNIPYMKKRNGKNK